MQKADWELSDDKLDKALALDAEKIDNLHGWRTISTAPKDRIIFLANSETAEFYCRWHKDKWCVWGLDGFDCMEWVGIDFVTTHWMPKPELPFAKATTGGAA